MASVGGKAFDGGHFLPGHTRNRSDAGTRRR
jgi:hypothetical protein